MKNLGMIKYYIISPTESPLTMRGKRHPNLADFLISNGESVVYITSTINHADKTIFNKSEIDNCKSNSKYPIHFFSCGLYKSNISIKRVFWNYIFSFNVLYFLIKHTKKNDIILFPSRPSELLLVALFIKVIRSVKLFIDVEDIWPDAFQIKNITIKFLFYKYCNIINKISIPYFDLGVHVSPNFKNWLKRYHVKFDSKLAVLGITDEENISQNKNKNKQNKKLTFFYGGTLTTQFNILPFLKALNNTKIPAKIILAGDNGSGNRHNDVINYLKINDFDFVNLGNIKKKMLINNLISSDIVIIPMVSGGLPKKFFDAIGCYKPIFNIGKGGVHNEIKKHNIGWSTPFDINEIEIVLNSISHDEINVKINNIQLIRDSYLENKSLEIIYLELLKCNNI